MVAVCSIKSSLDILGVTELVFWDEDVVQLVGVSFHRWCSWGGEPGVVLAVVIKEGACSSEVVASHYV